MKFTTKLFSILLVCLFTFGFSSNRVSSTLENIAISEYKEKINSQYNIDQSKVRFEGIDTISSESNSEIAEAFNSENTYTKLVIHLNNSFEDSFERPTDDIPMETAKRILKEQRANVKEYYTRTNNNYLQELGLDNLDVTYMADEYAPFIIAEFNNEITEEDIEYIYDLSEQDFIKTIYIKSDVQVEQELTTAINAVDATSIITNPSTNGNGVVVGILDVGIVDVNNSNFNNTNVKARKVWYYPETVSEHATMVASVALGMAPGASILSVEVSGYPDGEIGWMLDNEVNVVNMSYAYTNTKDYGYYTSESAYIDSIARDNWVSFVGSAGNEGEKDGYVTPPNGYNMLTVGACSNSGVLSPFSSYKENFNINFPNIVAPGNSFSIPTFSGYHSGTSFAAPMTTGAIAVLMQKSPLLMTYPERVLSIIMASTQRLSAYATSCGFSDRVGTGMLNLRNALSTLNTTHSFSVDSDNVGSYISSGHVYLEKGQRIRIAFASLVNNNGNNDTSLITDYDLYLFDSSDNTVACNIGPHNNEFIDYLATSSGTYTIKIKQFGAKKTTKTDFCSYTYFIIK